MGLNKTGTWEHVVTNGGNMGTWVLPYGYVTIRNHKTPGPSIVDYFFYHFDHVTRN